MTENNSVVQPISHPRGWRWFVQFSLRTLLLLVTAAGVACWWFLQPQTREEQLAGTTLRMRRQVRIVRYEEPRPFHLDPPYELMHVQGKRFQVVNDGRWRLYDPKGNLLVDGFYKSDQPHGKWTVYHANGRKAAEGMLNEGRKVGLWKTWDEEGRVIGEMDYAEGEQDGEHPDEAIPRLPGWSGAVPVVGMIRRSNGWLAREM